MQKRPNKDLVDALRSLGAHLDSTNDGYLPTTVQGTRALRGPARVSGTISSQYLTSLLIIAPLIEGGLTIEVDGDLTSKPYLDLTLDEMAKFGVNVENHDYRKLVVTPQAYRAGDHRRGRRCLRGFVFRGARHAAWRTHPLSNLGTRTRQGDYAFLRPVRKARRHRPAQCGQHGDRRPARPRHACFDGDVDMTSMPDVAPTLMMLCPFLAQAHAHHRARHLARQGMRPHRRAHARAAQARRRPSRKARTTWSSSPCGSVRVATPAVVEIETYHDHRIAMSFGVLGFAAAGPADPRSGLCGEDLSELLEGLGERPKRSAVNAVPISANVPAHAIARHRSRSSSAVLPRDRARRRSRWAVDRRAAGGCDAMSTTSPASITWSTIASTAPPKCSRASRPNRTRRISSSRWAASCASAAKSIARSPSTPSSPQHREMPVREQATSRSASTI